VSDGGLEELFSLRDEPVEEAEPIVKQRSRAWWLVRNVLLVVGMTVVTVAALRSSGHSISVLLVVAFYTGLRLVLFAVSEVAPPSMPRRRGGALPREDTPTDSLRAAVRRWERNLDRAHADPDLYARNVLPVLAELADERLRLRHGITRASDPRRARELLGDPLWAALHDPGRRTARSSELETYVNALERL
jgi:hypothetical protein